MLLKRIGWFLTIFIAVHTTLMAAPSIEEGKTLFMANCAACHDKSMKNDLTGPALAGMEDRWASQADLYKWIRNSQGLIATGNPRATELWNKWKPTQMTSFPGLTDDQIASLILFINDTANAKPADATAATGAGTGGEQGNNLWLFIGVGLVLAFITFALMRIIHNLSNIQKVQSGKAPVEMSLSQMLTTKGFIAFMIFAVTLLFGYKMVDNATNMQRQQHYQPDQPIKFSHKIHAGDNKIDCNYCHDAARRSKNSYIPGGNTCMNCHSAVRKGTITGTSEITKIFASVGYDPIAGKYIPDYQNWTDKQIEELYKQWIGQNYVADKSLASLDDAGKLEQESQWDGIVKALKNDSNGKIQGPIEWVRIHNVADHVYFNHSQHVTVGQIACQKCHGKVQEMEVVSQYSTLGMGWCISCHRETEVKFADNAYYEQYARFHKELKEGKREKVTVADIGGLECQKCHY